MLSHTAEYALRAVLYIAIHGEGEPCKLPTIAEALDVPKNYLSKTLHQLARAGVLRSERGPTGGFVLAKVPERLTLAEVVAPFDSARLARRCLLGQGPCSDETACAAHERWKTVGDPVRRFFASTRVSDLVTAEEAAAQGSRRLAPQASTPAADAVSAQVVRGMEPAIH
jgi:Rrf2 family protein